MLGFVDNLRIQREIEEREKEAKQERTGTNQEPATATPSASPKVQNKDDQTVVTTQGPPQLATDDDGLDWWQSLIWAVIILVITAVLSFITQLNMAPVYGSIPITLYNKQIITGIFVAAYATKSALKPYLGEKAHQLLPTWAYYITAIQWLFFRYSAMLGPTYGPIVTQGFTFYPVLYLSLLSIGYLVDDLELRTMLRAEFVEGLPAVLIIATYNAIESITRALLPRYIGSSDFFSRSGLQLLSATAYSLVSPRDYLIFAVPAILHTLFQNPHYHSIGATKRLDATLASYNFTLLERRDSITGYISVLESRKDEFRVMRCDHSLLGGEWLITPERKANGQHQQETIYSVFTMLESIRLVKSADLRSDKEKSALFIGLGVGTSPSAFITHGINTTILELDPIVYHYARKYFALPPNHTAIIADAVPTVAKLATTQPKSYDYIVHDVFTGGAEPTSLFTLEFLQGLAALLKDDGVIAINYAGDMTLPPPRLVLNTINAVFPTCRIFRDTLPDDTATTFLNMVVFCTKTKSKPIAFRSATEADFLGSLARKNWVPPQDDLELFVNDFVSGDEVVFTDEKGVETDILLRRGEEGRVEKFHPEAAKRHWTIMRTVLPDEVWELW